MGLFSSNYNRPGPGVSKDAPQDNRFIHYWKIYGRHFWDLMKLNLLFSVPAILLIVLSIIIYSKTGNIFLGGLPMIALSPFMAGLTYETRNFIREEHVFILHDFFSKLKENWKQFLMNGIVCYAVYEILYIAIPFYMQNRTKLGNVFSLIAFAVSLMVLFIFTVMQFYVPLQIVTFNLKLHQMYKNAAIFSISALGWNLIGFFISMFLVLFLYVSILVGAYAPLALFIIILLAVFLLWSFWSYTINSLVYPTINRMMIQPVLKKEAGERGETEENIDSAFTDWDSVHDEDDNEEDEDEDED
jgi:hypothetical protein